MKSNHKSLNFSLGFKSYRSKWFVSDPSFQVVKDPSHQALLLILSNTHATDQKEDVCCVEMIMMMDCTVGVLGSAGIAQGNPRGNPCTRGSHCTKTIYSLIT